MEGENRMSQPVFTLEPSLDEAMFYSGSPAEPRCIGHLRMDFGSGQEWRNPHSHLRSALRIVCGDRRIRAGKGFLPIPARDTGAVQGYRHCRSGRMAEVPRSL